MSKTVRVGVISDSHGRSMPLLRAVHLLGELDALIHLGDHFSDVLDIPSNRVKTYSVKGNCDFGHAEAELLLEFGGAKLFCTHGHHYGVKWGLDQLAEQAQSLGASAALYGHTHQSALSASGPLLLINPGSVSYPRNAPATCCLLEIKDGNIRPEILKL